MSSQNEFTRRDILGLWGGGGQFFGKIWWVEGYDSRKGPETATIGPISRPIERHL